MRHTLTALAFLTLSGSALAACTGDWSRPSARTLATNDGTEFHLSWFASQELKLSLVEAGRPIELVAARDVGYLVKGVAAAELQKFAQEAHWLALFDAPVMSIVWDAVKVAPCAASGSYAIAQDVPPTFADRVPGVKLKRAIGNAIADGQGLIRYAIRFDSEPSLPPERRPAYAGTLSFQTPAEALPGDTDVGGFSVVRSEPPLVAAPGTTLAQLRAQLRQAR